MVGVSHYSHGMKIRTADPKGRITIGSEADPNQPYSVTTNADGTITLTPITIPIPPRLTHSEDLRAVYVDASRSGSNADTLTVFSALGPRRLAELAIQIAESESIPIVVNATGVGAGVADELIHRAKPLGITVINMHPSLIKKKEQ